MERDVEKLKKQAWDQIRKLLYTQFFAVLSTHSNDQPYANLVAFASTNDLKKIIFLTPKTTRKYENITSNPKVAVLINDSQNETDDIYKAVCVTATGTAEIVEYRKRENLLNLVTGRHPHLKPFSAKRATVLVCVNVETYFLVSRFQNVVKIQVSP